MVNDDFDPILPPPNEVYVEVWRYAQGPTKPGKPWFRRAVQLAWTLGYRAGAATEAARRMRYEMADRDAHAQSDNGPGMVSRDGYGA